jgi:hypothetical protein
MGLEGFYTACSDFSQHDAETRYDFEVGIISRFPLDQIIEFDPIPDNRASEHDPMERKVEPFIEIGIKPIRTARGFLRAEIPTLKLILVVLHLKSSWGARAGPKDNSNALKRELVAAAAALHVSECLEQLDDYTIIVAGDFEVGHSDTLRNGKDLRNDCYNDCGNLDLYDETHALFGQGLVRGLRMNNLAIGIATNSYRPIPGSPIDNIYVIGADADRFSPAEIGIDTYGSDHYPVLTVYHPH